MGWCHWGGFFIFVVVFNAAVPDTGIAKEFILFVLSNITHLGWFATIAIYKRKKKEKKSAGSEVWHLTTTPNLLYSPIGWFATIKTEKKSKNSSFFNLFFFVFLVAR